MKIGIIGAGNVGAGLGKRLAAAGHEIVVSFARSPESVARAAAAIGGGARPGNPEDAARHGDVVILATPWAVTLDAVRATAALLADKIVWDTTNPLKADMSGLELGTNTSGGEEIAKAAPAVRIVKAIPPFAELLNADSIQIRGEKTAVFVASDDADGRAVVLGLVNDVGADGVDAGPLKNARYTEPFGMLLVQLAYDRGWGGRIGAAMLR